MLCDGNELAQESGAGEHRRVGLGHFSAWSACHEEAWGF